jgi:hypothetical protein
MYSGNSIGPERAVICRERKMARILRPIRSIDQVIGRKYRVASIREATARIRIASASFLKRIVIVNTGRMPFKSRTIQLSNNPASGRMPDLAHDWSFPWE